MGDITNTINAFCGKNVDFSDVLIIKPATCTNF